MRTIAMTILLGLCVVFLACKEDPKIRKMRLKQEFIEIQSASIEAILKNDLKFGGSLDEDEKLFAKIRRDLERCREIEAELRGIVPDEELTQLEETTKGIELIISKREDSNQRLREMIAEGRMDDLPAELVNYDMVITGLEMAMKRLKESNQDTSHLEVQLKELKRQQAAEENELQNWILENRTKEDEK